MAVAAVVVAGGIGIPAYIAGGSMAAAGATEQAEQEAYDAAAVELDIARTQESAALDAAVVAYSAEREVAGEPLPEDIAANRIQEARPEFTDTEVAAELDLHIPMQPTYEESAAIDMWVAEPPATETARERIQDYEAKSKAANEAEYKYEAAFEDIK